MAVTNTPIFVQAPIIGIASVATALTTRTNITGTTGLTQLTATSTNGTRVDAITYKASATSAAGYVWIWIYNGTTSFLFDEILCTAVTGSATISSDTLTRYYNGVLAPVLVLPPTYQLYASPTITQNANVIAFGGIY